MSEHSSKEELLRKAKEFVEQHEKKGKDYSSKQDDGRREKRRRKEDGKKRSSSKRIRKDSGRYHSSDDDEGELKRSNRKSPYLNDRGDKDRRSSHGVDRNYEYDDKRNKRKSRSRRRDGKERSDVSIDSSDGERSASKDENHRRSKKRSKEPSRDYDRRKKKEISDGKSTSKRTKSHEDESSKMEDGRKHKKKSRSSSDQKHKKKKDRHEEKKQHSSTIDSKSVELDDTKKEKLASILGPIRSEPPSQLITSDNYFAYHDHLRIYLYYTNGTYFEDLSSSETHKAFKKFCTKYNAGELQLGYYNDNSSLPEEALEQCKRTKHKWKFNTNTTELRSLNMIKSGVKKQTEYTNNIDKAKGNPSLRKPIQCAVINTHINNTYCAPTNIGIKDDNQKLNTGSDEQAKVLKMLGLSGITKKITIAPRK